MPRARVGRGRRKKRQRQGLQQTENQRLCFFPVKISYQRFPSRKAPLEVGHRADSGNNGPAAQKASQRVKESRAVCSGREASYQAQMHANLPSKLREGFKCWFCVVFFFLLHEKMDSSKRRATAKSHSILVLQLIASVTARLASRSTYSSVQQAARGDPAARSPRAFWEGVSTDSTQTLPKQCPIRSRDTSIGRLKPDCRNLSNEASPSARAQPGRQPPDVHLGESFPKCVYADSSWRSPFKAIELALATEQLVIDECWCFVVICSMLQ